MTAADQARAAMVDALRATGRVRSPEVEAALRAVPRHLFLPDLPIDDAYADYAVPVQFEDGVATSSASQPSMMAIMLEQLAVREGHQVLEIGAGTGYNAALLDRLVGPLGSVTSVDIDAELVASAAVHLAAAGVEDVDLVCADGALGHLPGAPYDRIVLTVGSADLRPEWLAQLAPEGRLLLPLAVRGSQLSVALALGADGVLRSETVRSCAFIRLRGIGAGSDAEVVLGNGLVVQPADGDVPLGAAQAGALDGALARPGHLAAVATPLGADDIWDGLGLWLSLTEPGAVRLLARSPEVDLADGMLSGPGGATIGLVSGGGLAAVVPGPSAAVRAFGGSDGAQAAQRLLGSLDAWVAAGRPGASDWRITAVPATAECTLVPPEPMAGPIVVRKEHCLLLMDLPRLSRRA
ncbi:methyltransferase domain-containing protein [Pseudonocardia sp. GCM10023141]|uniref:methyltransferase domain-containing protein n=1 Tax=Pseudonocardia sp. GCM10023141 TaxID=3252653 RepID=UPI00360C3CCF